MKRPNLEDLRAALDVRSCRPLPTLDREQQITFVIHAEELIDPNIWAYFVKYHDGWCCQDCGETKRTELVSHHLDRDRTNNRLVNGRTLCRYCHAVTHAELRDGVARSRVRRVAQPHGAEKAHAPRVCEQCGGDLAANQRRHARFCSGACRASASKDRRQAA